MNLSTIRIQPCLWFLLIPVLLLWTSSPCQAHFQGDVDKELQEGTAKPLYNGTSLKELLNLCGFNDKKRSETYESYMAVANCSLCEDGLNLDILGPTEYEAQKKQRWLALRKAQGTLHNFYQMLKRKDYILQFVLVGACVACGIYLIVVGHFNFHTNPTVGIPCWQYLRMGYMAAHRKDKKVSFSKEK
jgi:hypothetical protein